MPCAPPQTCCQVGADASEATPGLPVGANACCHARAVCCGAGPLAQQPLPSLLQYTARHGRSALLGMVSGMRAASGKPALGVGGGGCLRRLLIMQGRDARRIRQACQSVGGGGRLGGVGGPALEAVTCLNGKSRCEAAAISNKPACLPVSSRLCRAPPTAFDLNDASQAFELTQPVAQQPAAAGRVAFAVSGSAADVAALVSQAAALIIQPQAAVRRALMR